MENLFTDIRLAWRRIAKHQTLTVLSVIALACGIGTAAVAWSLISAISLRPLPLVDTDGLVVVDRPRKVDPGFTSFTMPRSYAEYTWLREVGIFDQLAAGVRWREPITVDPNSNGTLVNATTYFATFTFFEALGVQLASGRTFSAEEDQPGAPIVAILSDALWRSVFGGDPNVIGRRILVGNQPVVIIGVAPRGFRGIEVTASPDLYLPLRSISIFEPRVAEYFSEIEQPNSSSWLTVVARLGTNIEAGSAEAFLDSRTPASDLWRWSLLDINTAALPQESRAGMAQFSALFGIAVGLIVLIGCLAVGMLLLVRTETRRDEFAMCLALGASRWRLARGIVIEGVIVGLGGAVLALPLANWLFSAIRTYELPGELPVALLNLSLDARGFAVAMAVASIAVVLVSLIACSFGFSVDVSRALSMRSGGARRLKQGHMRSALAVGQVALALILLAGMGLFARSIAMALRLNPGYESSRLLLANVRIEGGPSQEATTLFFDEFRERLNGHSDIESATNVAEAWTMSATGEFLVDNDRIQLPAALTVVSVDDGYFRTMGSRLTAGREFSPSDDANAPYVAIVSESLRRLLTSNSTPVGRRIRLDPRMSDFQIVGVVPDVIMGIDDVEPLWAYVPQRQFRVNSLTRQVFFRPVAANTAAAVRAFADVIDELDGAVAITSGSSTTPSIITIDDWLLGQMSAQRFGMAVMSGLGAIAMLLTAAAIYVLTATTASNRRHELGIRAALGARKWQLASIVIAEGAKLASVGLGLGLMISWWGTDMIRPFLFRIEPFDAMTFGGVIALMLLIALVASLKPAITAMRVDPAQTLREE